MIATDSLCEKNSFKEYESRIHRVIDHIEQNIDKPLCLNDLAPLSGFSPFYFHRIFSAITGETLSRFITRIRLERAAGMLSNRMKENVTDIALDCGFASSAAFARAFREMFACTPSEWRRQKVERNIQEHSTSQPQFRVKVLYPDKDNPEIRWSLVTASGLQAVIHTEVLPPWNVAYVRHIGPYKGNSSLFKKLYERLFNWAGPRGLIRFPQTQAICIYHDDPGTTHEDRLRLSVGITLPNPVETNGDIGLLSLPGGRYARARFTLKPPDYEEAWNSVIGHWLPRSGFFCDDRPALELYLEQCADDEGMKSLVDICIPVALL